MFRPQYKLYPLTVLVFMLAAAPVAHADNRVVVHNSWGNPVFNTWGNCVRTIWLNDHDACAQPVSLQTVIGQEDRTVYFPFNRYYLTNKAKEKLNRLAETLANAADIESAKVVGYADRLGSTSYNERLSQKRAKAVRDFLVTHGYTRADVTETQWEGEKGSVTDCSNYQSRHKLIRCLQPDRRVEVQINYRTQQ